MTITCLELDEFLACVRHIKRFNQISQYVSSQPGALLKDFDNTCFTSGGCFPREHTRMIWKAHLNLLPPLGRRRAPHASSFTAAAQPPKGYDISEIAAWIFSEGIRNTCSRPSVRRTGVKTLKNCPEQVKANWDLLPGSVAF